jgi:hypothetical protein
MLNKNLKKLLVLASLPYSGIALAAAEENPQQLKNLPPELWQDILARLEGRNLVRASEVCQQWHELTKAERAKEKQLKLEVERLIAESGSLGLTFWSIVSNDNASSKELVVYIVKNYPAVLNSVFYIHPLLEAVMRQREEMVELLLSLGFSPNVELLGQHSPLRYAVVDGNVAIVEKLLKAGANKNKMIFGCTLLDVAREFKIDAVNQNKPDAAERLDAIIRLLEEK